MTKVELTDSDAEPVAEQAPPPEINGEGGAIEVASDERKKAR